MISFKIHVNGEYVCTAGSRSVDLLSSMIDWFQKGDSCEMEVRGMSEERGYAEHLIWLRKTLKLGDRVTIEVVESKRASKPVQRFKAK